jgi:hypothetical protein
MEGIGMMFRRILVILGSLAVMVSCGNEKKADETTTPCTTNCFKYDSTKAKTLVVNDEPIKAKGVNNSIYAFTFKGNKNVQYSIYNRYDSSYMLTLCTYLNEIKSTINLDDAISNSCVYLPGNESKIDFIPSETKDYLISVSNGDGTTGIDFSLRVISFQEKLDPLAGTKNLQLNVTQQISLVKDQLQRYNFTISYGTDYSVKVSRNNYNNANVYISNIPSVDNEMDEIYSGDLWLNGTTTYKFRANTNAVIFIGLQDAGNAQGSDLNIKITSP